VPHSIRKLNCWEFKNCGREPGGLLTDQLGECPVARALRFDGLNGGIAAGRACWMMTGDKLPCQAGTGGRPVPCHACDFYRRVLFEEQGRAQFRFAVESA